MPFSFFILSLLMFTSLFFPFSLPVLLFPFPHSIFYMQTVESILYVFDDLRFHGLPTVDQYRTRGRFALTKSLLKAVMLDRPLQLVLPAFPCKSPNATRKVLGKLPDKGEELALQRLHEFCAQVSAVYTPGCTCVIFSDGRVFADLVDVAHADVDAYWQEVWRLTEAACEWCRRISCLVNGLLIFLIDSLCSLISPLPSPSLPTPFLCLCVWCLQLQAMLPSPYLVWDSFDAHLPALLSDTPPAPILPSHPMQQRKQQQQQQAHKEAQTAVDGKQSSTSTSTSPPTSTFSTGLTQLHKSAEEFLCREWEPRSGLEQLDKDIQAGGDAAVLLRGFMRFLEQDRQWPPKMSRSAIKQVRGSNQTAHWGRDLASACLIVYLLLCVDGAVTNPSFSLLPPSLSFHSSFASIDLCCFNPPIHSSIRPSINSSMLPLSIQHCGVVARRMIVRNQCFSRLVSALYPEAIRLSIHAHNNAGPKYAIRLLEGTKPHLAST